ncbi:DUF5617 domain-containing protein [Legionella sp. D16C41]|uniref:DUF5617 domain-containing protein n=1 Tax=Legionella sp. D16C41 TaxID=3402688 RepID=UPI003AF58AEC
MFKYINLIDAQQKLALAGKISCLYDPISYEIPSDPVFVYYEQNQFVRLFSKQSIIGLQKQLQECHQLVKEGEQDKSYIKLALKQHIPRNTTEAIYKDLLLAMVKEGFSINRLVKSCEVLDAIIFYLSNMSLNSNFIITTEDLPRELIFVIQYITQLHQLILNQQEQDSEVEYLPISVFLEELILLQTAIVEENRKKLFAPTGQSLSLNEVLCPYSRAIINVEKTLASADLAKIFLKLIIAVVKISNLESLEVKEFLRNQKDNYLEEACQELNNYITKKPNYFTPQQNKFLNDIGISRIIEHDRMLKLSKRYNHLWSRKKSFTENTLTILNDYSKLHTTSPPFSLFITCHWNRKHHYIVKQAIQRIQNNVSVKQVIADLEIQARDNPQFNVGGSLSRRLEFINLRLKHIDEVKNKLRYENGIKLT